MSESYKYLNLYLEIPKYASILIFCIKNEPIVYTDTVLLFYAEHPDHKTSLKTQGNISTLIFVLQYNAIMLSEKKGKRK